MRGSDVARLREARSFSGSIDLAGTFASDATVVTTSGEVTLRFGPGASVRIDAWTESGNIRTSGAGIPGARPDAHTHVATLGSGAALVQMRTTSGSIVLTTL